VPLLTCRESDLPRVHAYALSGMQPAHAGARSAATRPLTFTFKSDLVAEKLAEGHAPHAACLPFLSRLPIDHVHETLSACE
jgi:hypothetical protein